MRNNREWVEAVSIMFSTSVFWIVITGFPHNHKDYTPYGKLASQEIEAEVMIHRADPHKIYTCENDEVPDSSINPNHYAVLDQKEALDAGYTPAGQGYCQ